MNILDFFCEEKPFIEEFQDLRRKYFVDLRENFYSCEECDISQIQKRYLKTLYLTLKKFPELDK